MANGDTKGPYSDDRTTRLRMSFDEEPTVSIETGDVTSSWNNGQLTLAIHHDSGAATVNVNP